MNLSGLILAAAPHVAALPPETPAELEPMVVITTRTPRPVNDVAGMVTVIDAARLQDQLVHDLDDLVRYEVGISAETAGTRFGFDGFNIRGIGGNRVAIEVDGVPMNDHFDIGSYASAGRGLIDPEFVQRVEILRGPASTLYGSDAIGGIASFHTWDPEYLVSGERGFRLRSGYDGADNGWFASGLAAFQGDRWGGVAGVVIREGEQPDHAVSSGSLEDSVDREQQAYLVKVVRDDAIGRLTLTATSDDSERVSDIRSLLGVGRFRSTTLLQGDDEQERTRFSAAYDFSLTSSWIDEGSVQVFRQDSDTVQLTTEERVSRNQHYERGFFYEQVATGFDVALFRQLDAWGADHRVGVGLEFLRTETEERREGLQTALDGSNPTTSILGEDFPIRDFPNSTSDELGVWVQDEISWDRLTLIPAVRFEDYALNPDPDALYRDDFPHTEVVDVDDSEVTPKLGALYALNDEWTIFGQYARGFRAPPFEDANIGLDIPLFNIRAIPNPDLESETSDGFELGVRHVDSVQRLELVAFYNDYEDFIETRAPLGPDPDSGVLLFQSRNLDEARIHGLEFRYQRELDWLPDWSVHASGFWADGEDKTTGNELAGLDPAEAIVGLRWNSPDRDWQVDIIGRGVAGKDPLESAPDQFDSGGYGVLDVLTQWQPTRNLTVGVGLFNLTDREYWRWQDVRGLVADDPVLPLLSRPGRQYAATVEYRF